MHILQCTKFCSLPSSATPIAPPSHCYGCTNYSPHPSSISLTVMDSMGKIVTDAHLTMYSVLFPSLLSHTYYSSLSLLRMHKLHSPILYPSLLLLRMHNFLYFFQNLLFPTVMDNYTFPSFLQLLLLHTVTDAQITLLYLLIYVIFVGVIPPPPPKCEMSQLRMCG